MRFTHPDSSPVLLSYCTNVHAAQDVAGIIAQLDEYALPIRELLGWSRLGLGLWLPAAAAARLAEDPALLDRLRRELSARGLFTATMNGFPYGDFHGERVKKDVYLPSWCDRRRLKYTVDLATVLAALLPQDLDEGAISTLPLGWRNDWLASKQSDAAKLLGELHRELDALAARTGRSISVGLEPEPGCVIERAEDVARHFPRVGERVGVCLDTCHLAVGFESPADFLAALRTAGGVPLVKLQAASALHARQPGDPRTRAALRSLAHSPYLHQVRTRVGDGLLAADDLPEAAHELPADEPWRVHFHAPLHKDRLGALETTRDVLVDTLAAVFGGPHPLTRHVEVETYTWSVLEPPGAAGLVEGIAAELAWTAERLRALELKGDRL